MKRWKRERQANFLDHGTAEIFVAIGVYVERRPPLDCDGSGTIVAAAKDVICLDSWNEVGFQRYSDVPKRDRSRDTGPKRLTGGSRGTVRRRLASAEFFSAALCGPTRFSRGGAVNPLVPPRELHAPTMAELVLGAGRALERDVRWLAGFGVLASVGAPALPAKPARGAALHAQHDASSALRVAAVVGFAVRHHVQLPTQAPACQRAERSK